MRWKQFTIDTTTAAEDLVAEALTELGVEAVQIEDNTPLSEEDTKGMFIDILPELPPDDGTAKVSFFKEVSEESGEDAQSEAEFLEEVRAKLEELRVFVDAGSLAITVGETQDTDWINNWKVFFKPFMVGDILIRPSWEPIPEGWTYRLCLSIDPGMAFGTGSHETTQLVLNAIQKYMHPQDKVLDVGTGSGILAIAALKLGASHAVGTDLDESAISASQENMAENDVSPDDFHLILGNIIDDQAVQDEVGYGCYDIVVANILAPVILMLQGEVSRHLKDGGVFIMSGILAEQEAQISEAIRNNPDFELLEVAHQGEWISLTARKITRGRKA